MPEANDLAQWVGRQECHEALIDAGLAARLAATLDQPAPALGMALPPLWHWAFFPPPAPQSELGADGHPTRGGFMPPIALPRRMWAGGRLEWVGPLRVGDRLTRTTTITAITEKQGSQGALAFVTLRHEFAVSGRHVIREEQDLVYRAPPPPGAGAPPAKAPPSLADWRAPVRFDPALLFRYSAVTFNAHRIHYDLPYAREEEGYAGLVVHGPLLATLLAERLVAQSGRRLTQFAFRAVAPLIAGPDPALVCGRAEPDAPEQFTLWVESGAGAVTMEASARVEGGNGNA